MNATYRLAGVYIVCGLFTAVSGVFTTVVGCQTAWGWVVVGSWMFALGFHTRVLLSQLSSGDDDERGDWP
jgi:hypothetical protein